MRTKIDINSNTKSEIKSQLSFLYMTWAFEKVVLYFNPLATVGEGEGYVGHNRYVFVVFSYLLYFYRQWHLCKFLNLGDLSTHLFGLVFLHPTSEKMRVAVHQTPPLSVSSINVGFF